MSVTQPGPTPENEQGEESPWEQHPEIEKPVDPEPEPDEAFWPTRPVWLEEGSAYLARQSQISRIVPQYAERTGFCTNHKREK